MTTREAKTRTTAEAKTKCGVLPLRLALLTQRQNDTKNRQQQKQIPFGDDNKKSKNKDNGRSKGEMRVLPLRLALLTQRQNDNKEQTTAEADPLRG
jgi:hypothetical protein